VQAAPEGHWIHVMPGTYYLLAYSADIALHSLAVNVCVCSRIRAL